MRRLFDRTRPSWPPAPSGHPDQIAVDVDELERATNTETTDAAGER